MRGGKLWRTNLQNIQPLSLFHIAKPKAEATTWSHALPQLDLWFVANEANVQTVAANAKTKGACVQLNAILVQYIIYVLIQSQRFEQAEELSKWRIWASGGFDQAEEFSKRRLGLSIKQAELFLVYVSYV